MYKSIICINYYPNIIIILILYVYILILFRKKYMYYHMFKIFYQFFSEPMWPIEARCAAIANNYFVVGINRVGTVSLKIIWSIYFS